jgi:hypothetical protein
LYSAKPVFVWGFFVFGAINLILSFVTNQYAYFVLRTLSGVAASATVSSILFAESWDKSSLTADAIGFPVDFGDI